VNIDLDFCYQAVNRLFRFDKKFTASVNQCTVLNIPEASAHQ